MTKAKKSTRKDGLGDRTFEVAAALLRNTKSSTEIREQFAKPDGSPLSRQRLSAIAKRAGIERRGVRVSDGTRDQDERDTEIVRLFVDEGMPPVDIADLIERRAKAGEVPASWVVSVQRLRQLLEACGCEYQWMPAAGSGWRQDGRGRWKHG